MDKIIFFTALVVFPFGQLFKIGFINLFDIAIVLLAMVTLLRKPVYPSWYKYFIYFILSCAFGLLVNSSLFTVHGSLYLLRLVSYSFVAIYISNFQKNKLITNHQSLITIAVVTAEFGWLQYLLYPDLTSLKYLGWDDHLLRMVGTFLDPTFLGLILVLGVIIATHKNYKFILYFLLFSLAFTYSRSSYFIASLFLLFKKKYLALVVFVLVILFLPKGTGEGTNLARTVSGSNKLINYEESIQIIKKSPVFGVGFNNICSARQKYLNDTNITSHACNGADSSILFLMATTGVVGLIMLAYSVQRIAYSFEHSTYYILLSTSFIVVLIHSLFANSLFYPHIIFWLFTLVGLQTKTSSQRS